MNTIPCFVTRKRSFVIVTTVVTTLCLIRAALIRIDQFMDQIREIRSKPEARRYAWSTIWINSRSITPSP